MSIGDFANPFCTWAELVRGLRDRFVAELGDQAVTAYSGEVLGELAGLITRCEHIGVRLERLNQNDPKAFDAFVRALEKS
jgi:hypothetical protein